MISYKPIPMSQVKDIACDMRHDILTMVHSCGKQNGHLGGCMSAVEILAVLYTQIMNINEIAHSDYDWSARDRFIMSKGHAGIAMYAAMKHVGLLSQNMINGSLRGDNTILYRHPKRNIPYGIECSVGSLGMGIGYGIGLAEVFIRRKTNQKVFVMIGDGECDEGAIWEGAAYASHRKLDNLTVIIDNNSLQLDGTTHDVLAMDNMVERWTAFGFHTIEIDGHDIDDIYNAFKEKHPAKPLAIIAHTTKGKGISFAENRVEWHDNYLSDELYTKGQCELGNSNLNGIRRLAAERFENRCIHITEDCKHTSINLPNTKEQIDFWHSFGSKNIIGEVSYQIAEQDDKFTLIYSDCANRIGIKKLKEKYPEKCYEVGISEQNQVSMAAAMALEGFHVFAVAYAPFITARVLDQIRVNLGYMQAPVCLIGLAAGFASSDLGATHTAFEDIANIRCIPGIAIETPVDTYEIAKSMESYCNIFKRQYIRITVSEGDQIINLVPYDYISGLNKCIQKGTDFAIIACGAIMAEVFKVMDTLAAIRYKPTIYSVHSVKPIDTNMLRDIEKSKIIFVIEEHSVIGGFGSYLAEYFSERQEHPIIMRIGIEDCYFYADIADKLREKSGLDASQIIKRILNVLTDMGVTPYENNQEEVQRSDKEKLY